THCPSCSGIVWVPATVHAPRTVIASTSATRYAAVPTAGSAVSSATAPADQAATVTSPRVTPRDSGSAREVNSRASASAVATSGGTRRVYSHESSRGAADHAALATAIA